jgi:outer membrane protein insertion porin family
MTLALDATMRHPHGIFAGAVFALVLASAVPAFALAGARGAQSADEAASRTLRLESVEVNGNHRASDEVVRRHLGLSPGDEVTVEVLESARLRLVATDYFSSVEVYTRRGSVRGAVVVIVDVVEHGNPVFETGFGYHDLNGWFLTIIGMRFDNTLGADSRTRIGVRVGFRLSGLDADWTRPVSDDGRFGVAVRGHVYEFAHRFFGAGPEAQPAPWRGDGWYGYRQSITRSGGEAALVYHASRDTRLSFGVSAEYIKPDSTFEENSDREKKFKYEDLPASLKPDLEKTTVTGFFLRAIRDTRNDPAYPTAGSFARLTLDINNSLLGGDEIYTRAEVDLRKHFHLGGGWVLSSHACGGITSSGARYYERYYLGGTYSIRGFEDGSLSDTGGDDGFWTVNQELRWPLAGRAGNAPRLCGLVFFDAGQGWRRGESFTASDVESAAGYGMRLRLPWIGTLGFDVGVPISRGRTDEPFRAHGSLGFSF